jgi:aromatic ring-opening dioxygenase LigB subunit
MFISIPKKSKQVKEKNLLILRSPHDTALTCAVEAGLEKVKEGATFIIKESRKQRKELENEFEKVKSDLDEEFTDKD